MQTNKNKCFDKKAIRSLTNTGNTNDFDDGSTEENQFPSLLRYQTLHPEISTYGKTFVTFKNKNLQYRSIYYLQSKK